MLLCVFMVWPTKFANTLNFVQNWFDAWKFMENVRDFKFGKFGLQFLFLKIISSHTHAFCSSMSMLWVVPKCFFQKLCFSSNLVSLCQFRLIQSIFRSIKIFKKKFNEPLSILIDRNFFWSIETRESGFKKFRFDLFKTLFQTFQNFSLSPTRQGSTDIFFVVFLQFSCKDSLSLSRYVYFTLPFALFSCFHA